MSDDVNVDVKFDVGMERVIAQTVAAVVPGVVKAAVSAEMAQVFTDMEGIREAMFDVAEAGVMDGFAELIQRSYAIHLARVAASSGVSVSEYAKIVREIRAEEARSNGNEA